MTVPMVGRWAAAAGGGLLVVIVWASVIETLIVARPVRNWLTRWVNGLVNAGFRVVTSRLGDYRRRDRVLAGQAAAILLAQLAAWLGVAFVGCWLLLWPVEGGWGAAFSAAVSSLFTLGYAEPAGAAPAAIVFAAAATGLVIVTLQIAICPRCMGPSTGGRPRSRCWTPGQAYRRGARSCWLVPITRWGPGCRRWTRCPACTRSGSAGPPTWPRATPPTCRWCGSAHRGRCLPG